MIVFILCLLLPAFIIPKEGLTDLEKHRLKGSVKSVMEIKYTLTDKTANAPKDKLVYQKLTKYDKYGYVVENILYRDGDEFLKSVYTFGSDGKPSVRDETASDGKHNLTVTYSYDKDGNLTEALYLWEKDYVIGEFSEYTEYYNEIIQNDIFSKVVYMLDYRGYVTEEKFLKEDASTSFSLSSKYDPNGNRLELSYFKGDGHLSWASKFKYDRYDNLIESRLFKSNRIAVLSNYKHQYDAAGNWVVQREEREVYVNILTAGLERADMVTERTIEYY